MMGRESETVKMRSSRRVRLGIFCASRVCLAFLSEDWVSVEAVFTECWICGVAALIGVWGASSSEGVEDGRNFPVGIIF